MKSLSNSLLLLVAGLIMATGCGRETASTDHEATEEELHAIHWLEMLSANEMDKAIQAAKQISGDVPRASGSETITKLCWQNGLSPAFLDADFNNYDFQYWQHALFFKQLAKDLTKSIDPKDDDAVIHQLFLSVCEHIAPIEPAKRYILWPYVIWHVRKGVCDRQAWVLCELAYQVGYETQIVYLRNPKTLISPHTICELRKGSKVWVADPLFKKLLPNMSVADIVADAKARENLWPGKKDLEAAVDSSAFWLPSYPQDYCPRNQALFSRLKPLLGVNCPRFGEPPGERLKKYLTMTEEDDRRFQYGLWFYPFRLLAASIRTDIE